MARKTKFGGEPPVPQKVDFEAKNYYEREQLRRQDIMYCGRADLVGDSFVTRTLEEMDDKILCPDCNTEMVKTTDTEYDCSRCKEPWIVTFLPRHPEFPSWPGKTHWNDLKAQLQSTKKKSRRKQ